MLLSPVLAALQPLIALQWSRFWWSRIWLQGGRQGRNEGILLALSRRWDACWLCCRPRTKLCSVAWSKTAMESMAHWNKRYQNLTRHVWKSSVEYRHLKESSGLETPKSTHLLFESKSNDTTEPTWRSLPQQAPLSWNPNLQLARTVLNHLQRRRY
jgi:hypothetical protein